MKNRLKPVRLQKNLAANPILMQKRTVLHENRTLNKSCCKTERFY